MSVNYAQLRRANILPVRTKSLIETVRSKESLDNQNLQCFRSWFQNRAKLTKGKVAKNSGISQVK